MERIFIRDRALVFIALAGLSILSWIYLTVLAKDMAQGDMSLMGMGEMGVGGSGSGSPRRVEFSPPGQPLGD